MVNTYFYCLFCCKCPPSMAKQPLGMRTPLSQLSSWFYSCGIVVYKQISFDHFQDKNESCVGGSPHNCVTLKYLPARFFIKNYCSQLESYSLFFFFFFWLPCEAWRILVSWPGIKGCSRGPPRNAPNLTFFFPRWVAWMKESSDFPCLWFRLKPKSIPDLVFPLTRSPSPVHFLQLENSVNQWVSGQIRVTKLAEWSSGADSGRRNSLKVKQGHTSQQPSRLAFCLPFQFSCLENPMDGGAWWATVHGVAKSQTRLNDFTFTSRDLGL